MPEALQNEDRYDFVLVPPHEMDPPTMRQLLQQAIEQHFQVSASVESRPQDVYVMTAIKGKTPPAKTGDESMNGGSVGWSSMAFAVAQPLGSGPPTPEMIREALATVQPGGMSSISVGNSDLADFRGALEDGLGAPHRRPDEPRRDL